ncbi:MULTISPECIES: zinc-dependent alcohol dehydrogenase [Micromonospora]|uniref:Glutathione-dependent formaldehyde dehydrogenase n=1 Tax=Micromonospora solifontis TaxID=2487138 RepID=A0ABX9WJW0_9ACTN|nr:MULTISPECIES: zinc-dependent alcohol dehydrogenase [Micromonospora]NES12436.1 glutathione-dependent formaldehyde dehydrogenase [Micromonospora sp. PPF5-17B]NES36352.1 glutathione-dependent formaldehyde dehydrogenase [Micromonospora solifontis]NES57802.1 glutathione-dependent formaldehyde dehydrogenase [Micromonospora sp. PPF5-6]RNL99593.1 glutathione-dependent formaldehyde dehydrogenase [Micromonospora solifontis]
MRALCWEGVGKLAVRDVPEPAIRAAGDIIVKVKASSVCGSDLHLINGYLPAMREGDILGHEFMGEVVETGPDVRRIKVGDRVVVGSVVACGGCWYCRTEQYSLCDNSNPQPVFTEKLWGHSPAGILGYSHAAGGYSGSHAEYIRVPFGDVGAFTVPDGVPDDSVVFASDAMPTGWMAADFCGLKGGEVVAVWGAGGVGQMAARSAQILGAERVIVIDRLPERLATAAGRLGVETINYAETDVLEALRELTAGRGPDACIEAVGMESHDVGPIYAYDKAKQTARLQSDRPTSIRQAIMACRKGGTVSIVGVYGGLVDKFPLGAAMNKALVLRMGQMHAQRYIPMLLDRIAVGEIDPGYLATHPMPLEQGAKGYEIFEKKEDGCLRTVLHPQAA